MLSHFLKVKNISTIEQINEDTVRSFLYEGRTLRNWTALSFIGYHGTLLVFFRWCISKGYLQQNPALDIEKPKAEHPIRKKLTRQQAFRILEVAYNYPTKNKFFRYRNHAIFSMFIYAGLRFSELLNLRLTDIDLENLTIFVSKGKGAKDRIIPISNTLAHTLSRYLEERKKMKVLCPEFFASRPYHRGLTHSALDNLIDRISQASGITFSAHILRHTFATLMLEGGCDIYSLSKMMGHSDIKTTTIYLAATAEHLRSQMTKHPLNIAVPTQSPSPIAPYGALEKFNDRAV